MEFFSTRLQPTQFEISARRLSATQQNFFNTSPLLRPPAFVKIPGRERSAPQLTSLQSALGLLVVVEDNITKHVLGIISDRDILARLVTKGLHPDKTTVEKIMTKKIISVNPDDTLAHATDTMKKEKVKRLIVLDHDKTLTGIISNSDLIKEFQELKKRILEITTRI